MANNTGVTNNILICDDELEIVKITEDLYDQAVELYQNYFMKYENYSIAADLLGTQQSIDEMEILIRAILNDGISFAAKHRSTNELVAMCCNKMLHPAAGLTLDNIFEKFTSPQMICIGAALDRMEGTFNLYKEWQIDCLFEIVFLSTRSDFAGKGISTKLSQHAIDYARKIKNDELPASENLPSHIRGMRPKAVCSVFTSKFSQRVGEKLGLEVVNKVAHTEFIYDGKTFAEKIDPIHEYSVFAAMRL